MTEMIREGDLEEQVVAGLRELFGEHRSRLIETLKRAAVVVLDDYPPDMLIRLDEEGAIFALHLFGAVRFNITLDALIDEEIAISCVEGPEGKPLGLVDSETRVALLRLAASLRRCADYIERHPTMQDPAGL